MALPVTQKKSVTVQTTLPVQPYPFTSERNPIKTERLIIRPFEASDLDALYELRQQPEVMQYTKRGVPDINRTESQEVLNTMMGTPDNSMYNFAICDGKTNRLIGTGGCHLRVGQVGWPEIGYMLRKEYHGKGYATEFVRAFLEAYWALPRVRTEVVVDASTVELNEGVTDARECLGATTTAVNKLSHSVLLKTGFELVKAYREPANNPQEEGDMVTLWAWTLKYPLNVT
ncbi:hypothetical protein V495_06620 [Pseudogymnoascus sp. VKM F-4514 (FW-929)]|nr:hypothetical protein V490_08434 [Pseudogymnoascus sp. VKM F-3557]KFY38376.1 hypothetical protein V495_06620 [Pseudogymnoascus sp. VKM F-4514 (FW-929)]KFY62137.1 hypothetical protein V497_02547 [Pseudogymnoascus sp. VKM F-4516 (FW-969)]